MGVKVFMMEDNSPNREKKMEYGRWKIDKVEMLEGME